MNIKDYYKGVAYATGYIAIENGKSYLFIRNLDEWYPKCMEKISRNKAYKSIHNLERDGKPQWAIKVKEINCMPSLADIKNISEFCRAYIEIHGILDMTSAKNRKGEKFKKPRLRIYGKEEILVFLNKNLPATAKKIQHIKNIIDGVYTGKTCALYYQSTQEIADILRWINGDIRNEKVWEKWKTIISYQSD